LFPIISVQGQNGQDSTVVLQLLSGDTVIYKLSQSKTDHITGFKKNKNKDIWTFKIYPFNDVAYYTLKNQEKVWIYQPDPSQGNFLKISQIEKFILGKKRAKYYYKPLRHFVSGMVLGLGLGLIDTYKEGAGFLNDPNGTLSLATPLLSTLIIRTKKYKIVSLSSMTEKEILESHYKKGYVSGKKIKNSIASFSGSLIGIIMIFIFNN
tara:strand:+ start:4764 stop:5387 length:624 start_codon:yes stop_codon:yes gene_type:complete